MKKVKSIKITKSPKKKRRPRGWGNELVSCYYCPIELTYPRRKLKNRKRVPVCITHAEEYDKNNRDTWPSCQICGKSDDWNPIWAWGGSVETTNVTCRDCGTEYNAVKLFNNYQIWMHGKPIEKRM